MALSSVFVIQDAAISIRQFKALEAITEHGSFAAAADALNVTQSAVSMQVIALEQALGVTLFDRKRRPPRLTADGAIVLRRAKAIVAQYDDLFDSLAKARPYRGTFRLGAIPTVLTSLLPEALMALRDREPGLTINVSSGLSGELMHLVEQGELDAALMHKPSTSNPALTWRDVAQQRIIIVAPPDSTQESVHEVFRAHHYIRFNRAAWVAPLIEKRLGELGIEPDTRAEIQSIEAIHLMVGLGFGVSILPDVGANSPSGAALRILDFGAPPIHRTIGLLSRLDTSKQDARRLVGDVFAKAAG